MWKPGCYYRASAAVGRSVLLCRIRGSLTLKLVNQTETVKVRGSKPTPTPSYFAKYGMEMLKQPTSSRPGCLPSSPFSFNFQSNPLHSSPVSQSGVVQPCVIHFPHRAAWMMQQRQSDELERKKLPHGKKKKKKKPLFFLILLVTFHLLFTLCICFSLLQTLRIPPQLTNSVKCFNFHWWLQVTQTSKKLFKDR